MFFLLRRLAVLSSCFLLSVPFAFAQPTETQIYVSDFTGAGSASLRRSLTRVFQVELLRVGRGIKAFTRKDLSDLLQREQYKEMLECDDLSCVREIVANFGIAMSAFGVVDGIGGGRCDLTIKIFDREDPVWAGNELTRCDVETLRDVVKKFANQLAEQLAGNRVEVGHQERGPASPQLRGQIRGEQNNEDVITIENLMWQKTPASHAMNWSSAKRDCENLSLGGYSDWRLASISDLRSVIHGCEKTSSSGVCQLSDSCLSSTCWSNDCKGCIDNQGPPKDCYWPEGFLGECSIFWSSSSYLERDDLAWVVDFRSGRLTNWGKKYSDVHFRCVRDVK